MNLFKAFNRKKRSIKGIIKNKINSAIINVCCKSPKLSILYYCLFNDSITVSSYKILNAVREFSLKTNHSWSNISGLIRNIHRLEKGMCIQNSERLFATDFIYETVKYLEQELHFKTQRDSKILTWSADVLDHYFKRFPNRQEIEKARINFEKIRFLLPDNKEKLLPFKYSQIRKSNISLQDFETLSKERKSVRFYDSSKKIEIEKLLKAVEISTNTPTACNKFPLKFHIITKEEEILKAIKIPYGITCFSKEIPIICFLISDLSSYHQEPGMLGTPFVDAGLVGANFMYALELQGLASCPINWIQTPQKEKEIRNFLNLKPYETCTICFTIGYPDQDSKVCFSQRKSLENAVLIK
jgi:nitroreductase